MQKNNRKSAIKRNQSQSFDSNWLSQYPIKELSKQSQINSGRLTCRYNNNINKNNQENFSLYSSRAKISPKIDCRFTNQVLHMSQPHNFKRQNKKSETFGKLRVNKSQYLDYLAFEIKMSRNIYAQNKKIIQFNKILQRKVKKAKPRSSQVDNLQKHSPSSNKNPLFVDPSQKLYKYKSATSSPFVLRQKHKKNLILKYKKQLNQKQKQNYYKNNGNIGEQKAKNTQSMKNSIFLQVQGQKPQWKQFESWRRMRYKITIQDYNKNKTKKQVKNKQNL